MQFILFILTYPFLWVLSRFPMKLLYIISDFFFFIIFYVVKYRKNVVTSNIKRAFPEKTEQEIHSISKKFFRHFTDLVMESVKSFSISKKNIRKRYVYENVEVVDELYNQGYSIALMGSHHNNWELSYGLPLLTNISCFGAYTKIKNPYYEKVIKASRTRFGYDGVPTFEFSKTIKRRLEENVQSLYILLSDQSPQIHKTNHWHKFLNVYVPVHTGAEILAKKHNFAVANMTVTKVKRGHYSAKFELITKTPNDFEDFKITEKFLAITEEHVKTQPEYYLWTHKRFKHEGKYDLWEEKFKKKK